MIRLRQVAMLIVSMSLGFIPASISIPKSLIVFLRLIGFLSLILSLCFLSISPYTRTNILRYTQEMKKRVTKKSDD